MNCQCSKACATGPRATVSSEHFCNACQIPKRRVTKGPAICTKEFNVPVMGCATSSVRMTLRCGLSTHMTSSSPAPPVCAVKTPENVEVQSDGKTKPRGWHACQESKEGLIWTDRDNTSTLQAASRLKPPPPACKHIIRLCLPNTLLACTHIVDPCCSHNHLKPFHDPLEDRHPVCWPHGARADVMLPCFCSHRLPHSRNC